MNSIYCNDNLQYAYRLQLTEGCISFHCDHLQCKSCSNYIYSTESNDKLIEIADDFAKNHQHENLLCPNFQPTFYDYSIYEKILIFNIFLQEFIKKAHIQNPKNIADIISEENNFPFLFSFDLNELDFESIHPPPELIKDFIFAEKNNPNDLEFLMQPLYTRIKRLITNKKEFNSLYHLRAIYVAFLFFVPLSNKDSLFLDLISHLMSLLPAAHDLLIEMISRTPSLIPELNKIVQNYITKYVTSKEIKKIDNTIWDLSKFIQFILVPANYKSETPIPYSSFSNQELSKALHPKRELRRFVSAQPSILFTPAVASLLMKSKLLPEGNIITSSSRIRYPNINSAFSFEEFEQNKELNPDIKYRQTYSIPRRRRRRNRDNDDNDDNSIEEEEDLEEEDDFLDLLPFHDEDFSNISDEDDDYDIYTDGSTDISAITHSMNVVSRRSSCLRLNVRRNRLLDDTVSALLHASPQKLAGQIKVEFSGEPAIDLGGVSREFFTMVTNTLFSPDFAMFKLIGDGFYWFLSGENTQSINLYTMLGSFIGIAINNKVVLPIRFPLILYKKLRNETKFTIADFSEISDEEARSLQSLIDLKSKGENIELAGLAFDSSEEYFGSIKVEPLIENGSEIPVTNENVDLYIEKFIDWKLNKSIEKVFNAFKNGYDKVNNTPMMRMFVPEELNILVSGEKVFDWVAFKNAAVLKNCFQTSKTIKDLWDIFDNDWDEKKKITFFYFITGIKTAPIGGLANLHVKIELIDNSNLLPVSHTCFNHLVLPDYQNREILSKKLDICLDNCEGFGLM